jgi:hypothetical protein
MDTARSTVVSAATGTSARRADVGSVRLGERDVTGLLLCGAMYGAPYDLLAGFLGVRPDRLRGVVARWRRAGYAATGRLGPGPAWCWLTRSGLAVTGQHYALARPALGRLAHIHAVLAVRLSLQDSPAYRDGRAWGRSERRIRAAAGGRVGGGHVPNAEVSWPDVPGSGYAGECWAIEAELTPSRWPARPRSWPGCWPVPPTTSPSHRPARGPVMTGWFTWRPRPRAAWSTAPPPRSPACSGPGWWSATCPRERCCRCGGTCVPG